MEWDILEVRNFLGASQILGWGKNVVRMIVRRKGDQVDSLGEILSS